MKKVSLNDIAQSLNVSKALVSFVLNGQGEEKGISPKTQKRVKARAKELNYIPNYIARGLRLGKSNTVGLIVADISNKFYAKIAKQIEAVAARNNYHLIICSSDEDPQKEVDLIEILRERQVDGLIISTTQKDSIVFKQLKKEHFPFVLIDRRLPKLKTNYVGVENMDGAYLATQKLINNGFQKIALLKISPDYLSTIREREAGYKSALKDHQIKVNNKLIREIDFNDIEGHLRPVLNDIIQPSIGIQAIFSLNNHITVACLEYLNELNIRVPDDIAIVSFDDIELFRLSYPTITAIAQPIEEIGNEAVNILFKTMNGELKEQIKSVILPVKLIERRSCGSFLHNELYESKKQLIHINN